MSPSIMEMMASIIFFLAIIHTFMASIFMNMSHHYATGSWQQKIFHYLGEVECVFLLWSFVLMLMIAIFNSPTEMLVYLDRLNFTEPMFVVVIMSMCAARPLVQMAEKIIIKSSLILPFNPKMSFYIALLILGPVMGSFITEPAAMTITALILLHKFYAEKMSTPFKYATLGLLFVNISIGGTLTHFAAPPIVMIAHKWDWNSWYIFSHFGWKALLSIVLSTSLYTFYFRRELQGKISHQKEQDGKLTPTWWLNLAHIFFVMIVVMTSHHAVFFVLIYFLYLAFFSITHSYQDDHSIKSALMVGLFLAGLIILGDYQKWWLQWLLSSINDLTLYLGATLLTGITDNAALTYLGSLVPGLSDSAKYALVAGAVTGGGLTVIANAPNPAGQGLLKSAFSKKTIAPLYLFLAALIPTIITILCFELLPHNFN